MTPSRGDDLPEVAFLLVGQLRGFLSPSVQGSIAVHATMSFRSELFVLLKLARRHADLMAEAAARAAATRLGATRVQIIIADGETSYNDDRFGPIRTASERGVGISREAERPRHGPCPALIRNAADALFHRYRAAWRDVADAFSMVQSHEETVRSGRLFRYLVKLRSDEELCAPLPPLVHWRSAVVHQWQPLPTCEPPGSRRRVCHATDDHLAIVPRAHAEAFFGGAYREAGASCNAADCACRSRL